MTTFTGRSPSNSYKDILQVSNSNSGVDATLRDVEDGEGTVSAVKLSTTHLQLAAGKTLDIDGVLDAGDATSVVGLIDDVFTTRGDVLIEGASGPARLAAAAAGLSLVSQGAAADPAYQLTGLVSVQVMTATATWTKPTGINTVVVEVIAGGGGGGGVDGTTAAAEGGGGGGGGAAVEHIDVTAISSESVTVGTGGAGGTSGANAGAAGTSSSFGAHCSATGGAGGAGMTGTAGNVASAGGAGGAGTGGDLNISGSDGGHGRILSGVRVIAGGHGGGTSRAVPVFSATSSAGGKAGNSYGGGGSGGTRSSSGGSTAGGAGADGVVIVWEYR